MNGVDVARKVVILSRICGLEMQMENVSVSNIVPEPLQTIPTAKEFMQRLEEFDSNFDMLKSEALNSSQVLRHVGSIDVTAGKASVGIKSFPISHPFAQLKGSDNILSIQTRRFSNPMIIQGAGAGAAVTAHGVVADLIKVAEILDNRK